jgi:DNA-directed RNA polymerase subunit RPC12/RpoP
MRAHQSPPDSVPGPLPPCPDCGGKMILSTILPTMFAAAFDNITYRCTVCGTETTHAAGRRDAPQS